MVGLGATLEVYRVEWVERNEFEWQLNATTLHKLLEDIGHTEKARPRIEGKAIFFDLIEPSSRSIIFLYKLYFIPLFD